ncbi:MAG: gliding motility-associated C-terminal domain-containing protein, partial [Chitinophagales bacterium]|nr:gliding motility-associated C-terminal domain-containing protein [Chitinophagales bacterium]
SPAGATYTWSGGLVGANPTNVVAGTYTVTVTDNNACSSVTSATINAPISFTATTNISQPSCGQNNGGIAVSPNGAGFSFAWTGGLSGDNPNNLSAGTYTVTVTNTTTNCTATASATLNSNAGLTVNMAATQPTCGNNNGEILVTPNGANYNYVWNNAAINGFNPINLAAGTYTVTVTETVAGCSATASVVLNNSAAITAPVVSGVSNPYCVDETVAALNVSPSQGGVITWFADNGLTTVLATSNTFTPPTSPQAGTVSYWVVETASGCQSPSTQVDLVFEVCSTCNVPTPVGVNTAITTCEGTLNTTAFEVTNNDATATVHWYDAANQEVGTGNTFVPTVAGTYTAVTVANNDPTCVSPAVTATLTETVVGDASFAYSAATYCQGTLDITPTISGTNGGTFSATGLAIDPTTGAFDATTVGTFVITYAIGGNCSASSTFEVTIVPSIVLTITGDTDINLGEGTQLTVTGGTTYTWNAANSLSCTDCANPVATPTQTTSYTVQTAGNECAEPVSITVTVNKPQHVVVIPNAFSPNNDGVNDVFSISGINIATIKLLVYDRWGQKMFEAEGNLNNGWDGTYRGFNCELGVYVYYVVVTYTDGTTEMFKNNLTLVR